jgi:SAM-dependent methyltransferase
MQERVKTILHALLSNTAIRRLLAIVPLLGRLLPSVQRIHPFDRQYGIDTSGFVPVRLIVADETLAAQTHPYSGCHPSVIRPVLSALANLKDYHFVDLGCGKGRAMVVATEFPFCSVSGIELSSRLVKTATRNMEIVKRQFPARPPCVVVEGNAVTTPLPEGKLVLFLFHSFGPDLVAQLIKNLETSLAAGREHIFFAYDNPVYGHLLDASPVFTRWYAETLPWDKEEPGFGPEYNDPVVIWQSVRGAIPTPHLHANRAISITRPGWRADLSG